MKDHRLFAEALAWPFIAPGFVPRWSAHFNRDDILPGFERRLAAFKTTDGSALATTWHPTEDPLAGLTRHAKTLLQPIGNTAFGLTLHRKAPGQEILRWRAVSQRLAPGLLAAAAAEGRRCERRVRVLPAILVPRGPVAHLHVHANAGVDFEALWTRLMTQGPNAKCEAPEGFPKPLPSPEESTESTVKLLTWPQWLARMRLVRMLLAAHLHWPSHSQAVLLGWLFDDHRRRLVEAILEDLGAPLSLADESDLARAWPHDTAPAGEPGSLAALWAADPIHAHFPGTWPEGALLAQGLRRWSEPQTPEVGEASTQAGPLDWRALFLAYVRTRCLLYAHLVLDPAKSGLTHFTETFVRANPYLGDLAKLADPLDDDPLLPVDAAEVRVSPGAVRKWLKTVKRWPKPPALVAHFIRGDGTKGPAATVERLMGDARDLAGHIDTHPECLATLRALDVAGNETTGPLWQVVPALRHVQRVAEEIARWAPVDPLHLTLHVGEDFEHLLSGLRAVDEPLAWDLVGRGDRLGHALALGWKVEKWAWGQRSVKVRRGDRLLDLGWSLYRLEAMAEKKGEVARAARRWMPLVRERLNQLLSTLGLRCQYADDAKDLFRLLGQPEEVLHMSTTRFTGPFTTIHELWWAWMHGVPEAVACLEVKETIETVADIELMQILQAAIAQDLAAIQVVVELNPSSNLSIGALDKPVDQPLFQLRPWGKRAQHAVPVTLSADDPLQLATCHSDELAYAWAGMVAGANVAPAEANAWLEQAVADAWRGRFAVACRPGPCWGEPSRPGHAITPA